MKLLKSIYPYIIIIVVVVLIRSFVITPVTVVGTSMVDTLEANEVLLLSKVSYKIGKINRYDIVVIREDDDLIIKRVYGLPGDQVEYKNNRLYINDVEVEDKYATNETSDFTVQTICLKGLTYNSLTSEEKNKICNYDRVPEGYYLVLGDNRGVSMDSRSFGFVDKDDVLGKAVGRIWPLDKLGGIE